MLAFRLTSRLRGLDVSIKEDNLHRFVDRFEEPVSDFGITQRGCADFQNTFRCKLSDNSSCDVVASCGVHDSWFAQFAKQT